MAVSCKQKRVHSVITTDFTTVLNLKCGSTGSVSREWETRAMVRLEIGFPDNGQQDEYR